VASLRATLAGKWPILSIPRRQRCCQSGVMLSIVRQTQPRCAGPGGGPWSNRPAPPTSDRPPWSRLLTSCRPPHRRPQPTSSPATPCGDAEKTIATWPCPTYPPCPSREGRSWDAKLQPGWGLETKEGQAPVSPDGLPDGINNPEANAWFCRPLEVAPEQTKVLLRSRCFCSLPRRRRRSP